MRERAEHKETSRDGDSEPDRQHAVIKRAAEHAYAYLSGIADRPVRATASGAELQQSLGGSLPLCGEDPSCVIDQLAEASLRGTVASQSPRYFGFVNGGSLPAATAADWLVSAWDQNAQVYAMSPIASVVEQIVSEWLKDIFALPPAWSVGVTTGCQMANFTGLLAARHHVLAHNDWDVERDGLFGAPPIEVIVSDESHRTIFSALKMAGLGAERVRRAHTDGQGRIRMDSLAALLKGRKGPCIVCAQAGNVNTGSVDPIKDIGPLVRERGAWLHVDGAFGLWAATTKTRRYLLEGMDLADSLATDAHKWLNVPYDAGLVFTAHPEDHQHALVVPAHYIQMTPGQRDSRAFTPEESRRARAVPIYAALRVLGREGVGDMVDRCCDLAAQMAKRLASHDCVRILNDVVLNQVLVQFRPPNGSDDAAASLTTDVIRQVQEEGTCWAGGTVWHGQTAMRVSVCNWSTSPADIDRSVAGILAIVDYFRLRR